MDEFGETNRMEGEYVFAGLDVRMAVGVNERIGRNVDDRGTVNRDDTDVMVVDGITSIRAVDDARMVGISNPGIGAGDEEAA